MTVTVKTLGEEAGIHALSVDILERIIQALEMPSMRGGLSVLSAG